MRLPGFFVMCCCILLTFCTETKTKNPRVAIQTKLGDIIVELYPDKAPKTVAAFLSYVDSNYYQNATFYRVLNRDNQPSDALKATLIQGGLWRTKRKIYGSLPGIPHESTDKTGLVHKDGTISLARVEPGTASSEFFICLGDQPGFDFGGENNPDKQGYAAFGKVIKGMNIVHTIFDRPEDDQYFIYPIFIFNIVRVQ